MSDDPEDDWITWEEATPEQRRVWRALDALEALQDEWRIVDGDPTKPKPIGVMNAAAVLVKTA